MHAPALCCCSFSMIAKLAPATPCRPTTPLRTVSWAGRLRWMPALPTTPALGLSSGRRRLPSACASRWVSGCSVAARLAALGANSAGCYNRLLFDPLKGSVQQSERKEAPNQHWTSNVFVLPVALFQVSAQSDDRTVTSPWSGFTAVVAVGERQLGNLLAVPCGRRSASPARACLLLYVRPAKHLQPATHIHTVPCPASLLQARLLNP